MSIVTDRTEHRPCRDCCPSTWEELPSKGGRLFGIVTGSASCLCLAILLISQTFPPPADADSSGVEETAYGLGVSSFSLGMALIGGSIGAQLGQRCGNHLSRICKGSSLFSSRTGNNHHHDPAANNYGSLIREV
jgi:hypothetical protein